MACDNEIKELLEQISNLKSFEQTNEHENLFDVAGFPYYENVVSNILGFFINPEAEHGMKDLWITSLLNCYPNKRDYICGQVVRVEREFATEDQKRIDLLIETDNCVICIENKIYAGVNNPFESYHKTAKEIAAKDKRESKEIIEILLTVSKEGNQEDKEYNFINITYQEYLNEIENNLGKYVLDINTKWFVIMREFVSNIEKLYGDNDMENYADWNKFIDNNEAYSKLFKLYKKDVDAKRSWLESVKQRINETYQAAIFGKTGYTGHMSIYTKDFICGKSKYTQIDGR